MLPFLRFVVRSMGISKSPCSTMKVKVSWLLKYWNAKAWNLSQDACRAVSITEIRKLCSYFLFLVRKYEILTFKPFKALYREALPLGPTSYSVSCVIFNRKGTLLLYLGIPTILGKIDGNFRPRSPRSRKGKGGRGFAFPFYSVQDCSFRRP